MTYSLRVDLNRKQMALRGKIDLRYASRKIDFSRTVFYVYVYFDNIHVHFPLGYSLPIIDHSCRINSIFLYFRFS